MNFSTNIFYLLCYLGTDLALERVGEGIFLSTLTSVKMLIFRSESLVEDLFFFLVGSILMLFSSLYFFSFLFNLILFL